MPDWIVHPSGPLSGTISVPGDKSISHRALLLGAIAEGTTRVSGFLPGGDCRATLACLRQLGVRIDLDQPTEAAVHGGGGGCLHAAARPLDCVRSGTTMRLLAGVLAGQAFDSVLTGEAQLLRRPMERVASPLRAMGAAIETSGGRAPIAIRAARLRGAGHRLPVASAQVKSALLLAGLAADGVTTVIEPGRSRDHTERMLRAMGVQLSACGSRVTIRGRQQPRAIAIPVPGDVSSAAFPIVAALVVPGSDVAVRDVGLNPTRTGLLDVLARMGGRIDSERSPDTPGGEPIGHLAARGSRLFGCRVAGEAIASLIDEIPVLAVAATQAEGTTEVRDAAELRVKETDRIETVVAGLRALGARIEPLPDGFVVHGPVFLGGGVVDSQGDHRLAMAFAVAGLAAAQPVRVQNVECVDDSFPGFLALMRTLGARVDVAG